MKEKNIEVRPTIDGKVLSLTVLVKGEDSEEFYKRIEDLIVPTEVKIKD